MPESVELEALFAQTKDLVRARASAAGESIGAGGYRYPDWFVRRMQEMEAEGSADRFLSEDA